MTTIIGDRCEEKPTVYSYGAWLILRQTDPNPPERLPFFGALDTVTLLSGLISRLLFLPALGVLDVTSLIA